MEETPRRGVELIIEDGDLATWMPINNAFALKPDAHPLKYWNGLVIPIGAYKKHEKPSKKNPFLNVFGSVRFERADGSAVKALMGNLEWINIVADGREPGSLHPRHGQSECEDLEKKLTELNKRVKKMTKGWLQPSALMITYWQGPEGYDISVTDKFGSKGRRNSRYAFQLKDPSLVRVKYKHTQGENPELLEEVTRIVVSSIRTGGGPGGGGIDPPTTKP